MSDAARLERLRTMADAALEQARKIVADSYVKRTTRYNAVPVLSAERLTTNIAAALLAERVQFTDTPTNPEGT